STVIKLLRPLTIARGVDPSSSAIGEYDRVPAYTTLMQARVLVMRPAHLNVDMPIVSYREGRSWNAGAVQVAGHISPTIKNYRQSFGYGIGLGLNGNYGAVVSGGWVKNLPRLGGENGYGVSDQSVDTKVENFIFDDVRHGYDTGSNRWAAGT